MSVRVLIHILNDETVMAELEKMPEPDDNCIVVHNPRRRDGKPLPMLADGVNMVIYPWTRINYVEVLDEAGGVPGRGDNIVGFFRESGGST